MYIDNIVYVYLKKKECKKFEIMNVVWKLKLDILNW